MVPKGPIAPVFAGRVIRAAGIIGGEFARWVEHYNSCRTCQHDDWYLPAQHLPRFCDEGRKLFRRWDLATTQEATR